MTKKSKTATSKPTTEKAATVHHLDGKATKTNTTNKKENWLQIHVECTVNTDVAPKWLKEKMNYLKREQGLNDEQAANIVAQSVDKILTGYLKEISKKGIDFKKIEL